MSHNSSAHAPLALGEFDVAGRLRAARGPAPLPPPLLNEVRHGSRRVVAGTFVERAAYRSDRPTRHDGTNPARRTRSASGLMVARKRHNGSASRSPRSVAQPFTKGGDKRGWPLGRPQAACQSSSRKHMSRMREGGRQHVQSSERAMSRNVISQTSRYKATSKSAMPNMSRFWIWPKVRTSASLV